MENSYEKCFVVVRISTFLVPFGSYLRQFNILIKPHAQNFHRSPPMLCIQQVRASFTVRITTVIGTRTM